MSKYADFLLNAQTKAFLSLSPSSIRPFLVDDLQAYYVRLSNVFLPVLRAIVSQTR
jgi:hypothetical protein